MTDKLTTVVTPRGQTSIPALLRKILGLKAGRMLRWQQISSRELRVIISDMTSAPGPLATLGYARKFSSSERPSSDEILKELREGEHD